MAQTNPRPKAPVMTIGRYCGDDEPKWIMPMRIILIVVHVFLVGPVGTLRAYGSSIVRKLKVVSVPTFRRLKVRNMAEI